MSGGKLRLAAESKDEAPPTEFVVRFARGGSDIAALFSSSNVTAEKMDDGAVLVLDTVEPIEDFDDESDVLCSRRLEM